MTKYGLLYEGTEYEKIMQTVTVVFYVMSACAAVCNSDIKINNKLEYCLYSLLYALLLLDSYLPRNHPGVMKQTQRIMCKPTTGVLHITYSLHGSEFFLRSQPVFSQSRNSVHFMEPKGSLPHSQVVEIIYTYFQF